MRVRVRVRIYTFPLEHLRAENDPTAKAADA